MRIPFRAMPFVLLCATAFAAGASTPVCASPQEPSGAPPLSVERVKERLERPARRLTPSTPVQLRPTFKSRVDQRVFVLTLEEDLHKTFDLTDLQRQSAEWRSRCCGIDLGMVFDRIEKALDERRIRKTREQIARELAELRAANAAAVTVK